MNLNAKVTFLEASVLLLVGLTIASPILAAPATSPTSTSQSTKTIAKPESAKSALSVSASITRATNLIDFQDGSRYDGIDYGLGMSYSLKSFNLSTRIAYSQNLRNEYSKTANDWADIPVTMSMKGPTFDWFRESKSQLSYSATAIIPQSQSSIKKDQLQTSVSGKIGISISPASGDGISAGAGLSLGQNFHAYEEDINGSVLNKYSSNQSLSLGYGLDSFSFSLSVSNKTRVTYKGGTKSAFEVSEEAGFSFNKNYSVGIGHSNSGSTLKANGSDSNIDLYNENSSVVYLSLGAKY